MRKQLWPASFFFLFFSLKRELYFTLPNMIDGGVKTTVSSVCLAERKNFTVQYGMRYESSHGIGLFMERRGKLVSKRLKKFGFSPNANVFFLLTHWTLLLLFSVFLFPR